MERCGSGRTAGPFAAAVVGLIAAVTVEIVETRVVDVPTALLALGAFAALMRFQRRNVLERLQERSQRLLVVLRHRALSIARLGTTVRQRHGFQEPFPVFENLALPPFLRPSSYGPDR
jgi:hypothetical protein